MVSNARLATDKGNESSQDDTHGNCANRGSSIEAVCEIAGSERPTSGVESDSKPMKTSNTSDEFYRFSIVNVPVTGIRLPVIGDLIFRNRKDIWVSPPAIVALLANHQGLECPRKPEFNYHNATYEQDSCITGEIRVSGSSNAPIMRAAGRQWSIYMLCVGRYHATRRIRAPGYLVTKYILLLVPYKFVTNKVNQVSMIFSCIGSMCVSVSTAPIPTAINPRFNNQQSSLQRNR